MTKVQVGEAVQYVADTTHGPFAAQVINVKDAETQRVDLIVWSRNGRMYPAFDITPKPEGKIRQFWRYIPGREPKEDVNDAMASGLFESAIRNALVVQQKKKEDDRG